MHSAPLSISYLSWGQRPNARRLSQLSPVLFALYTVTVVVIGQLLFMGNLTDFYSLCKGRRSGNVFTASLVEITRLPGCHEFLTVCFGVFPIVKILTGSTEN